MTADVQRVAGSAGQPSPGRGAATRAGLVGLVLTASVAGFFGLGASPASAAATATVTWNGSQFSAAPTLRVGQSVAFRNASSMRLVVSGTTANWAGYQVTVSAGATSPAHSFAAIGHYGFTGAGGLAGTSRDSGTIIVRAAPSPSPTRSPRPSPTPSPTHSPRPSPTTHASPTPTVPAASPTPSAGRGGHGHAGGPALGSGGGHAGHGRRPGKPPVVALPSPTIPGPSPTASASVLSLAQPVPRRRFGLPGAVAAVLLAGVAAGVVRLARAEYGPLGPQRRH